MDEAEQKRKILKQWIYTEESFGIDSIPLSELERFKGTPPQSLVASGTSWDDLEREALSCRDCRLCETRTQVVFGEGSRNADLMFVGEGPGFEEDRQGRPFVGKAGQLLTKIIEAGQNSGEFGEFHAGTVAQLIFAALEGVMLQWVIDEGAIDLNVCADELIRFAERHVVAQA